MDNVMSTKSSKIAITKVYEHIEERYLLKKTNVEFMKGANK